MQPQPKHFKDRYHAGQMLAEALMEYAYRSDVIVIGLPRDGMPTAFEVARKLHARLDIVVVRKLGVPGWEKIAMGAIASGGVRILEDDVMLRESITPQEVRASTLWHMEELHRLELKYRGHAGAPDVEGKTVIIVDDGIATGMTIHSAVRALRPQDPAAIIICAPTASRDGCERMRPLVDAIVALMIPDEFDSIGRWYESFNQTSDDEVRRLLDEAREHADRLPTEDMQQEKSDIPTPVFSH
ncbi:MAG: phosphoribosyltransferase [Verrucomicrobia bacterium]|nr:phosphoribosyltransferase [Verrucomicrobiota bacterium]